MLNRSFLSGVGALALIASASIGRAESPEAVARFTGDTAAKFGQGIRVDYKLDHQDFNWSRIREQYEKDGTIPEGWKSSNGQAIYGNEWLYKRDPGGGEMLRYSEVQMPLDTGKHPDLVTSQTLTVVFDGVDSYILSEERTKTGEIKRRLSVSPGNYLNSHFVGGLRYTIVSGLCIAQGENPPIPVDQALGKAGAPAVELEPDGKLRMKGIPSDAGEKIDLLTRETSRGFELLEVSKTYDGTDYRTDVIVQDQTTDSRGLSFPKRVTFTVGRPGAPARIATAEVVTLRTITPEERDAEFTLKIPEGTLPGTNEATGETLRSVPAAVRLLP